MSVIMTGIHASILMGRNGQTLLLFFYMIIGLETIMLVGVAR